LRPVRIEPVDQVVTPAALQAVAAVIADDEIYGHGHTSRMVRIAIQAGNIDRMERNVEAVPVW
jgi:hypothetical protein